MQRKPTKNTRGPNTGERKFQAWLKKQPCCVTGNPGPSIVHHCEGATFKHNKVLIGHWFCIPLCQEIDNVITLGSRRKFRDLYGLQSRYWLKLIDKYSQKDKIGSTYNPCAAPDDVYLAIMDWNK